MDSSAGRIERLKGWLDHFRPLPADVVAELGERYDVRLTYHSTALEGNTLTQSETQMVLEKGITVGGKTLGEHLEVIGHREALGFVRELADAGTPLTERDLREVHALVVRGGDRAEGGAYRTLDVMAAGTEYRYPSHLRVPDLMREFVAGLDSPGDPSPVRRAADAHLAFVTIHPFRDGNGRVGRLLMNLILLRAGFPIAVIPVERRAAYLDALVAAQGGAGPLSSPGERGRGEGNLNDLAPGDREPFHLLVAETVEASLIDTLRTLATALSAGASGKPFYRELRDSTG